MAAPVQIASVVTLTVEVSAATDNDPAVTAAYVAVIDSFRTTIGVSPGIIEACLCEKTPGTVARSTLQDKPVTVHLDGVLQFTGHVKSVRKTLSDRSVHVTLLDHRALLNKTDVGIRHLGADGIQVIGADIRFNMFGLPNKANVADGDGIPQFVYELPDDGAEPNCGTIEALYWTYGDILKWLWWHYVDDIAMPTIPASGGLQNKAAPMNFLGAPVGEAIQAVLDETTTNMGMNADGTVYFFSRVTPAATTTVRFVNEDETKSATEYTLEYPESFSCETVTADTVTDAYVVGGRKVCQINTSESDYYGGMEEYSTQSILPYLNAAVAGGTAAPSLVFQNFSNYLRYKRRRFGFRASRYEAHNAGKNIRRKDWGKRVSGDLLVARDRNNIYVNPESECAFAPVSVAESLSALYPNGAEIDPDRTQVIASSDGLTPEAPNNLPLVIDTEVREYVHATHNPGGLPTRERLVLRDEFVHKTTESIHLGIPITGTRTLTGAGATWDVEQATDTPPGWSNDFDGSGSGAIPAFTAATPSGVVVDGIGPLNEIKNIIESELGRRSSVVTGWFPRWVDLKIGTKITTSGGTHTGANGMELVGDEVIVGIDWDGFSQRYRIIATNHFGPDAMRMAQAFVDTQRYRRGV